LEDEDIAGGSSEKIEHNVSTQKSKAKLWKRWRPRSLYTSNVQHLCNDSKSVNMETINKPHVACSGQHTPCNQNQFLVVHNLPNLF